MVVEPCAEAPSRLDLLTIDEEEYGGKRAWDEGEGSLYVGRTWRARYEGGLFQVFKS